MSFDIIINLTREMIEQSSHCLTLKQYVNEQLQLIQLDYELETNEKQKTEIPSIDLCFILRTKSLQHYHFLKI